MSLSHAQFYALPVGTEIDAMKKRFTVVRRELRGSVEQPVLVDNANQQVLFGAIYVTHLMHLVKGIAPEVLVHLQAPPFAEVSEDPVVDAMADVEHYENLPGDALQPELALMPEILLAMRRDYPLRSEYEKEMALS